MGKATENERVKLSATFFNNVAVAAFAGGAILPLYALQHYESADTGYMQLVKLLGTMGIALSLSYFFRNHADRIMEKLQD
jgi:hypothetical protein